MSVSLYCPNCGENLGKDTENAKLVYCSICGFKNIKNQRGYEVRNQPLRCDEIITKGGIKRMR